MKWEFTTNTYGTTVLRGFAECRNYGREVCAKFRISPSEMAYLEILYPTSTYSSCYATYVIFNSPNIHYLSTTSFEHNLIKEI